MILFLATQGWQKLVDEYENSLIEETSEASSDYTKAIGRLCSKFKISLEVAGVVVAQIVNEFSDMLLYATQFISLSSRHYQAVWWTLFHSPNASDWKNVLTLARLLFSLPVSNGKLERVFSTLKNIKQSKRSAMSNELLDDLLCINVEKLLLESLYLTLALNCGGMLGHGGRIRDKGRSTVRSARMLRQVTQTLTLITIWMTFLEAGTNGSWTALSVIDVC